MSLSRHPDIEIYIKNQSPQQIIEWLKGTAEEVIISKQTEHSTYLTITFDGSKGDSLEALLQQKVSGKAWSSLWFKQNNTPWDNDLECAKSASQALTTQVRCIKSGWDDSQDTSDEEQWWKIEENEAVLITWNN